MNENYYFEVMRMLSIKYVTCTISSGGKKLRYKYYSERVRVCRKLMRINFFVNLNI